ncbi:hypothetical protein KY495_16390 [Massilia sp. PAMC28688]|uniref:hypothetical protein n=1 Tax=Massilia sp. PAMC28688 TaxID=2861283 RepID=UPI001C63006C|nr:hypothetical protein [Massilia sp. PAMC28688]QYF92326.1 hypothetical protein KY495_16390 [Massilia sp. PAMC28688]
MTTFSSLLLACAGALCLPGAQAAILTFDDLAGSGSMREYGGLSWTGWQHADAQEAPYSPASGNTRLFNISNDNAFAAVTAFQFQGAHFAGYATVSFHMFLNGSLVAVSDSLTTNGSAAFLASGYGGMVDRVSVMADLPQYFVMDNVMINSAAPVAVAEPAGLLLMAGGLGALALLRRRPARKN